MRGRTNKPQTRLLRCLVGGYKGHLVRYPASIAERLIASGRAEEPNTTNGELEQEVATTPAPWWSRWRR